MCLLIVAALQVTIQLAGPNLRCNVSVAAGALTAAAGEPTAGSNTLSLLWDLQGPQVSSCVEHHLTCAG